MLALSLAWNMYSCIQCFEKLLGDKAADWSLGPGVQIQVWTHPSDDKHYYSLSNFHVRTSDSARLMGSDPYHTWCVFCVHVDQVLEEDLSVAQCMSDVVDTTQTTEQCLQGVPSFYCLESGAPQTYHSWCFLRCWLFTLVTPISVRAISLRRETAS